MTTLREAAQQALEALEAGDWYINQLELIVYSVDDTGTHEERAKVQVAITALRAALAEPVQKPVAWRLQSAVGGWAYSSQPPLSKYPAYPLYTAPPQRKPLTDEEIALIVADCAASAYRHDDFSFARAIERAHGIGTEVPATLTKPCGSLGEDVSLCRYPDCSGGQAGTICNSWCPGARK